MSAERPQMELSEYWSILKRRKWRFLLPFAAVLGIGVAMAFLLPAVYRSEATILIERQTIPSDLVETTVNSYVQEEIQEIRQRIIAHENLRAIAEEYNLVASSGEGGDEVVRQIAEGIEVEMVDVQATRPDERGERVATIAFTVAFEAGSPEIARNVAREVTERFMREHRETRAEHAASVSGFLTEEAAKLQEEITRLEQELATFKQGELKQLPELMNMNLRLYEKTEDDIQTSQDRIRDLQGRIESLQAELSLTDPYREVIGEDGNRVLTGSERLSFLMTQFLQASSRYTSEHPDVRRLQREIKALARQNGDAAQADDLLRKLTSLQAQLRDARDRYSDDHPDVARLSRAVSSVENGLKSALVAGSGGGGNLQVPPDNPRYVTLQSQLESTRADLNAERTRLQQLQANLEEYQQRLFQTPVVERDFKSLSRDYQNALNRYAELREKQMQARLAQELETSGQAQRFVLVDPARLPDSPERPNRIGIGLLSLVLALGGGLGSVAVAEYNDRSVRGHYMVRRLLGAPPLATIPYIRGPESAEARSSRRAAAAAAAVGVAILTLVALEWYRGSDTPPTSASGPAAVEAPGEPAARVSRQDVQPHGAARRVAN